MPGPESRTFNSTPDQLPCQAGQTALFSVDNPAAVRPPEWEAMAEAARASIRPGNDSQDVITGFYDEITALD